MTTLITQDHQLQIRGLLTGAATPYEFGSRSGSGIGGLGSPERKAFDLALTHADGVAPGTDRLRERAVSVPYVLRGTEAQVYERLVVLEEAWRPSPVDLELHLRLPGWGHRFVVGRPEMLDADTEEAFAGLIFCFAVFLATDPIWRTPEES